MFTLSSTSPSNQLTKTILTKQNKKDDEKNDCDGDGDDENENENEK